MSLTGTPFQILTIAAAILATVGAVLLWNRVRGPRVVRVLSRIGLLLSGYAVSAVAVLVSINIAYGGLIATWSDLSDNMSAHGVGQHGGRNSGHWRGMCGGKFPGTWGGGAPGGTGRPGGGRPAFGGGQPGSGQPGNHRPGNGGPAFSGHRPFACPSTSATPSASAGGTSSPSPHGTSSHGTPSPSSHG
jgi:hypothetical protein